MSGNDRDGNLRRIRRDPLQAGERIYAVGDIHGRSDCLDRLWDLIGADLLENPAAAELIYLGDYSDRGADSCGVLDRLSAPPDDISPATCLLGNHDHVFMRFLLGHDVRDAFRSFGGEETLRSYDVRLRDDGIKDWTQARFDLLARIPPAHIDFLQSLVLCVDRSPYFFCHAGVEPGVALDKQDADTLIWIRDDFLNSERDHGRIVVHGHTPVAEPVVRFNRIGIDTGAFATGVLTCAVLEKGSVRILQATL